MLNDQLATNYQKLDSLERLSLLGQAILRGDRAEIGQLTRSAPERLIETRHHVWVAHAFDQAASAYLIDQLSRATGLYALLLPPANPRTRHAQTARLVAYEFLQHQKAWVAFSRWLNVPPELAFALSPLSEPIMGMADKTARALACKRDQARAIAARDQSGVPPTAAEILAQWQRQFNARVDCTEEPEDTQNASSEDSQGE